MRDAQTTADFSAVISGMEFLNIEAGRKHSFNDDEFYLKMLGEFVEESKLGILQKSCQQHDWQQYRINVHTIKSSAAYIGADILSQKARELEKAVKENNQQYVQDNHVKFMEYYKSVLDKITDSIVRSGLGKHIDFSEN